MVQLLLRNNGTQVHTIFNLIAMQNTDNTFLKGVTSTPLILTVVGDFFFNIEGTWPSYFRGKERAF